ncbi:hypothetical protein [Pedobacter sp. P26]|uniref:LpxL/LpxP family acyltransferase n=1 Tax=Pedobacter sp. P26 TaxID=3423956 RepID=UPI003D66C855
MELLDYVFKPGIIDTIGCRKNCKKTNRPVFYLKINHLKRGYYEVDCVPICLNPAETVEFEITEMHTHFLEDMIKEAPAYWLWSHRRWKYKPEQKIQKVVARNQNAMDAMV